MRNLRIDSPVVFSIVAIVFLYLVGTVAKSDTPTTPPTTAPASQPAISLLETELVFPGSSSHGQPESIVQPPAGCELLTLHAPDGTEIAALFGKTTTAPAKAGKSTLLFFYGNGMCMATSVPEFDHLRSMGFNVIMTDYQGYGMSGGIPSEAGCYAAADAAYDYLLTRADVDHNRIVSTGWSIGAAVAIDLANRKKVAGLVTFSAFTSMTDMSELTMKGFPQVLPIRTRFDNLTKIKSVPCPIFMAHGSRDSLVPPEMLDRLGKAARSKVTTYRVLGAGHNDIFQLGGEALDQRVKAFVDGLSAP